MAKQTFLTVEGSEIKLLVQDDSDYISLTDIDTKFEGNGRHIENWLRNQNTIEYLATWELLHNPDFNSMQFHGIRENIGINRFLLSAKKWIETVNAIGIKASSGRYGGTFAHKDIAFHFCLWLSPSFQLYVAKEFQRIKEQEAKDRNDALDWSLKRTLAKINYRVHSDAVKTYLIPPKVSDTNFEGLYYASEADILNVAMFGMTAKAWREANPTAKGNIRDEATTEQLLVLSNLENLNAEFIKLGMDKQERLKRLNETAIHQMGLFSEMNIVKMLGEGKE